MKTYKNNPSEQHVLTFRIIGFILACATVYTALNWKTYSDENIIICDFDVELQDEIEYPEIVHAFQSQKPKPMNASMINLENSLSLEELFTKSEKKVQPSVQIGDDFDDLFTDNGDDQINDDTPDFRYLRTPEFPGGEDSLIHYIKRRFEYPSNLKGTGIQGIVYMAFSVDKRGHVKDVQVVRGLQPRHMTRSVDNRLIEILENMPLWQPGEKDGYAKTMTMSLPINIVVQ